MISSQDIRCVKVRLKCEGEGEGQWRNCQEGTWKGQDKPWYRHILNQAPSTRRGVLTCLGCASFSCVCVFSIMIEYVLRVPCHRLGRVPRQPMAHPGNTNTQEAHTYIKHINMKHVNVPLSHVFL